MNNSFEESRKLIERIKVGINDAVTMQRRIDARIETITAQFEQFKLAVADNNRNAAA